MVLKYAEFFFINIQQCISVLQHLFCSLIFCISQLLIKIKQILSLHISLVLFLTARWSDLSTALLLLRDNLLPWLPPLKHYQNFSVIPVHVSWHVIHYLFLLFFRKKSKEKLSNLAVINQNTVVQFFIKTVRFLQKNSIDIVIPCTFDVVNKIKNVDAVYVIRFTFNVS